MVVVDVWLWLEEWTVFGMGGGGGEVQARFKCSGRCRSTRLASRYGAGFEFELGIPYPQGHESTTEESDVDGTKARGQTPECNI